MTKTLTYSGFAISSILIILAFVTAKSYTQLGIAVLLYPLLAYFALRLFPRKTPKTPVLAIQIPRMPAPKVDEVRREKVDVVDIDKRTFLKLVGTAGVSLFLFSLLGRRVENALFGGTVPESRTGQTEPPATDGYKITEVYGGAITFYGFTNKDSAWFIMRGDTESGSFRYTRGENNFPGNWKNRENLKYDYYHNLF